MTQSEVCSETHRLMFSPSNPHHHFLSPSLSFRPSLLRGIFGSMEQFQNHLWDYVMWCRPTRLIGLSNRASFSRQALHSKPSLPSRAVIGLDVIRTLMCWDVVCKLIAEILGTWCQSFFFSFAFPLSRLFSARLHEVKMIPLWNVSLPTLLYLSMSSIPFHFRH